jgi:uncharacterized membrane-anchored protein
MLAFALPRFTPGRASRLAARVSIVVLVAGAIALSVGGARADDPPDSAKRATGGRGDATEPASAERGAVPAQAPTAAPENPLASLGWRAGPASAEIAGKAKLPYLDGYVSLDAADTERFLVMNGNLPGSQQRWLIAPDSLDWFAVLDFDPVGYVKDDEKIDADDLMKNMKAGNQASAEERRKQGLARLDLVGWYVPPHYDTATRRLEWGTRLQADGGEVVNYTSRLLGRTGVTSAILVADPQTFDTAVKEFKTLLGNFEYLPGERYAEYKEGDRIAEYGLAALVAGGAAAAAFKFKGLWKLIGVAVLGGGAAVWAGVKRFLGRRESA